MAKKDTQFHFSFVAVLITALQHTIGSSSSLLKLMSPNFTAVQMAPKHRSWWYTGTTVAATPLLARQLPGRSLSFFLDFAFYIFTANAGGTHTPFFSHDSVYHLFTVSYQVLHFILFHNLLILASFSSYFLLLFIHLFVSQRICVLSLPFLLILVFMQIETTEKS